MGHSLEKLREFQIPELYKGLVVQAGETEGEEVRIWGKDLLQREEVQASEKETEVRKIRRLFYEMWNILFFFPQKTSL